MRPTTKKMLALGAALSLGLAACGEDEIQPAVSGEAAAVEESTTTTTEAPSAAQDDARADDPAATLRATLTSVLQEHAYLTGATMRLVIDRGADDAATGGALAALDQNTAALGEVIALVPGMDDPGGFTRLWGEHVTAFVDYATGRSDGDRAMVREARGVLERYQHETADMLESLTDGELLADELFGELEAHVTMVTGMVDSLLGEADAEVGPVQQLRDAGDHMVALAATLADGIASAHEEEFSGDAGSVPSETRSSLAADLQEHTYLTLLAAERMTEAGARSAPEVQEVTSLVLASGEGLANAVAGAVGNASRNAVLTPWQGHSDALLAYAEAAVTGGDVGAARAALDGTSAQVAAALSGAAGGADVSAGLGAHVDAVVAAVDALAAGDPQAWSLARAAAQVAPQLAATLAPALSDVSAAQDAAEGQGSAGGTGTESGASGGAAPDAASEGGGSSTGGSAGGGGTGEGAGSSAEDTEPPGSPAESGTPAAEGE